MVGDCSSARVRRFLLRKQVRAETGLGDTTIWRMERAGLFPKRVEISPGRVGWASDEIDAWKESRLAARSPA